MNYKEFREVKRHWNGRIIEVIDKMVPTENGPYRSRCVKMVIPRVRSYRNIIYYVDVFRDKGGNLDYFLFDAYNPKTHKWLRIPYRGRLAMLIERAALYDICPDCEGVRFPCKTCRGSGRVKREL